MKLLFLVLRAIGEILLWEIAISVRDEYNSQKREKTKSKDITRPKRDKDNPYYGAKNAKTEYKKDSRRNGREG